jgi:hypothetical protein
MANIVDYQQLSFVHFGNSIFAPVSIKTTIIKQYISFAFSEISKIISFVYTFMYTFVYDLMKKENVFISKIYKFKFDMDNIVNIIDIKIILLCIVVYFGIYIYDKWNTNIVTMRIAIKQLQIENELLRTKIDHQYNKNNIIADEIDTIHTEVVKCIKKIRKVENELKKMDYY